MRNIVDCPNCEQAFDAAEVGRAGRGCPHCGLPWPKLHKLVEPDPEPTDHYPFQVGEGA